MVRTRCVVRTSRARGYRVKDVLGGEPIEEIVMKAELMKVVHDGRGGFIETAVIVGPKEFGKGTGTSKGLDQGDVGHGEREESGAYTADFKMETRRVARVGERMMHKGMKY